MQDVTVGQLICLILVVGLVITWIIRAIRGN